MVDRILLCGLAGSILEGSGLRVLDRRKTLCWLHILLCSLDLGLLGCADLLSNGDLPGGLLLRGVLSEALRVGMSTGRLHEGVLPCRLLVLLVRSGMQWGSLLRAEHDCFLRNEGSRALN